MATDKYPEKFKKFASQNMKLEFYSDGKTLISTMNIGVSFNNIYVTRQASDYIAFESHVCRKAADALTKAGYTVEMTEGSASVSRDLYTHSFSTITLKFPHAQGCDLDMLNNLEKIWAASTKEALFMELQQKLSSVPAAEKAELMARLGLQPKSQPQAGSVRTLPH